MSDVYALLRGRDFETREYKEGLKEQRFSELEEYVANGLDNTTWFNYISLIQSMGFRNKYLITSRTNFFYSYAFYLIGKYKHDIEFHQLEEIISKWFVMSALTSRYSGSSESVFEGDLALIGVARSGEEFISALSERIDSEMTNDFWEITMSSLLTSSSARNPQWFVFVAAQLKNNVELLFSSKKLADSFDPTVASKKSQVDKHHVFPKNYLSKIGIDRRTDQNQVANYIYLDYKTNIQISDDAPMDYFAKYEQYSATDVKTVMKHHALPPDFFKMDYETYLKARRQLLSNYIRKYFENI